MGHTAKCPEHHAEAVVHGHRYAHPVRLRQLHLGADEPGIVDDVVVRKRRCLGRSRGTAGELYVDRIVELQGILQHFDFIEFLRGRHVGQGVQRDKTRFSLVSQQQQRLQGRKFAAFKLPGT